MIEKQEKLAKALIVFVGVVQLSFSQVHIGAITKVFASNVGIFLFAFVLATLLCVFRVLKIAQRNECLKSAFANIIAIAFGGVYISILLSDVKTQQKVTMEIINSTLMLSVGIIFLLSIALIITLNLFRLKSEK